MTRSVSRCSNCRQEGHNRLRCTNPKVNEWACSECGIVKQESDFIRKTGVKWHSNLCRKCQSNRCTMGKKRGERKMGKKRGERKDGSVVEHCGIRIASKWNYCPMCGKKKETKVVLWS